MMEQENASESSPLPAEDLTRILKEQTHRLATTYGVDLSALVLIRSAFCLWHYQKSH